MLFTEPKTVYLSTVWFSLDPRLTLVVYVKCGYWGRRVYTDIRGVWITTPKINIKAHTQSNHTSIIYGDKTAKERRIKRERKKKSRRQTPSN